MTSRHGRYAPISTTSPWTVGKKKPVPVPVPTVHLNTTLTVEEIESLELVGIHQNNWQRRNVRLYADPLDAEFVYAVGRTDDGSAIVTSHDRLSECMNFRITLDYWKHGQKVYTRN